MIVSDSGLEALGAFLADLQQSADNGEPQKTNDRLQALRIIVEAAELSVDSKLWQLVHRSWEDDSNNSDELAGALQQAAEVTLQRDLELDGLALWSAVERIERELKLKFADVDVENWRTVGDVFACI